MVTLSYFSKVRSAPSVIHKLRHHMELRVFSDILSEDGTLGFNGNAVAKGFIIAAETHIKRGVILRLFQKSYLLQV